MKATVEVAKEIIKFGHYSYLTNMKLFVSGNKIRPIADFEELSEK